ncbi:MAG TPA: thioredoxin [Verrucomicrobiae bacterium]
MNANVEIPGVENELTVTDQSFGGEVLAVRQPVLVDLWAAWCGPCRMIVPLIHELAVEYAGRIKVVKLNVDENPETAARFNISSIPTLLVFKNGRVVDRITGLTSKKALANKLDAQLN